MADRGRDLSFDILSDVSKFDLTEPAKELDDLGNASKDAAKDVEKTTDELKRLAAQGKDAQRALDAMNFDRMGKDAKANAAKVDNAFDTISRSAKTNFDKVDKEIKEAGDEGFKDLKEEAGQSGREAAQSFSGQFSDITDFIQETAAQAFAGFGPLGAAAGVAAALGIGLITKAFGDAQEAAQQAKAAVAGWTSAIIDAQGQITNNVVQQKLQDLFASEENADKLKDLRTEAKRAGVDFITYALAVSGSAEAQERLKEEWIAANKALSANGDFLTQNNSALADQRKGLEEVADRAGLNNRQMSEGVQNAEDYAKALRSVNGVADQTANSFEGSATAIDTMTTALADNNHELDTFVEPAQTFITLLDKQKQAAEDAGKKFKTSAKDVGSFITQLGQQVRAQESFTKNLKTLAQKGVSEGFIQELEAQGPAAAQAVKTLTTATPAQVKAINSLYARQGKDSGDSWKTGLAGAKAGIVGTATDIHNGAKGALSKPISIPTKVEPPPPSGPNSSANAAEHARQQAQAYANAHPILFPARIAGVTGKGPVVP